MPNTIIHRLRALRKHGSNPTIFLLQFVMANICQAVLRTSGQLDMHLWRIRAYLKIFFYHR